MIRRQTRSEFEYRLETETGEWLRHRFQGYALTIAGFVLLAELLSWMTNRRTDATGWSATATSLGMIAGCTAAFLYVRRFRPSRRTILTLALWLYTVTGALSLIVSKAILGFVNARVGHGVALAPDALPLVQVVDATYVWGFYAAVMFSIAHWVACMFIPWTWKESLRPALIVWSIVCVIVVWDAWSAKSGARVAGPVTVALALVGMLPGTLTCYDRTNRFRRAARQRYESASLHQLQDELIDASRFHESLFPPRRTHGPLRVSYAYEPLRGLGGDLVFLHPRRWVEHGPLHVVLLDVTGHGIAAALTVGRVVSELERIFDDVRDPSPKEVVTRLNSYAYSSTSTLGMFITTLVVRVDPDGLKLTWASAGQPPAFVLHPGGSMTDLHATAGLLGMEDDASFACDTAETTFHAGDVLVAYTDGVNEVAGPGGDRLGDDGVRKIAKQVIATTSAEDLPETIMRGVTDFSDGLPSDDALIVVVSREQPVAPEFIV